ncbi:MAG: hypothetical protein ACK5MR_09675 [Cumulibacter sp.]
MDTQNPTTADNRELLAAISASDDFIVIRDHDHLVEIFGENSTK